MKAEIVWEKSGNFREKPGKSQEIYTGRLNIKVLPFLRFNLMISISTRGTKSGEATPQSPHESFDAGPGN